MSGDPRLKDQPLIFYSDEMTLAKKILIQKHAKFVEIEEVEIQQRWRTGGLLQE
tara:strand:+ start:3705 stop:3866 length:162 start_codon:yes stop_codon:yes gene_type:complete